VRIHLDPLVEKIRKIEVLKPDGRLGLKGQHISWRVSFCIQNNADAAKRMGYSADKSSI
jgi:hypothetical protein